MTQKELRAAARVAIGQYLLGQTLSSAVADIALGVLNTPQFKGE